MTSEVIIDVQPKEISIALLEDKQLVEYQNEPREVSFSVGNIYVAKVRKLMPGLNACFVDVGYEKDAFLHYLDLGTQFSSYEKYLKQVQSDRKRLYPIQKAVRQPDLPKDGSVQNTLKVGQEVLVQVVKEPISTKGPRLTCELSFAGRYIVLIPFGDKVNVSSKIKKGEERSRLKQLIQSIKPKNFGVIVRTVAEGKRAAELDQEMKILLKRWDEAISALYAEKDTDIFITGSNSKLLSSELSTFFTGRYVDLRVHTLNFAETLDFKRALGQPIKSIPEEFSSYLAKGGFPSLYVSIQTEYQDDSEITDIYNSILYKDLVERKNIRNTELLSRVTRFVMDSIGSPISAKSISDYLKNEKISLSQDTIYKYLDWLEEAMIIEKIKRYDLRGKELLKTQEKYYLADIGLLYAINGRSSTYLSGVLENLVYHELVSHGYKVYVGKNGSQEIDFIAEQSHQKIYFQVAAHISDKSTAEREFGALRNIQDNFPKYVLTLDQDFLHSEDGVEAKYLPEFILDL